MKKALLVIAPRGFQDMELDRTRKELLDAGFDVVLGSTEVGECQGKYGGIEKAEVALKDAQVAAYDRIGFIGGPGALTLKDNPDAHRLASDTLEAGKPLGAICIAPLILAAAGVLQNCSATVWNTQGEEAKFLQEKGAIYTGESVTSDGLIVTGNGPDAAEEFGKVFAAMSSL